MKFASLLLTFFSITTLFAQDTKKQQDINAIKSMCGCYEVTFNFAETFEYSEDSTYMPSETKTDKALEWVQLVKENDTIISMQHLLIVGPPNRKSIVKHWRQDWQFENTHLYVYDHDNKWSYVNLPAEEVKGQWTQKVFQVDDSPRYEGSASWVHVDGKSYWENTTPAPLPRREYTKRSDYNVAMRTNRHEIVDNGWIHDQDNDKVVRKDGQNDVVLAQEKGHNTYVKVDDSKCKPAQEYWVTHNDKWVIVRAKWAEVFNRHQNLSLHEKVDNKVLYKYLFDEENFKTPEDINPLIESFVIK